MKPRVREREREEGEERKLLVCERGVCERVVLECLGCPYLSDLSSEIQR